MVTLLVGEEETPFNIHMDLLCEASPFFKSAFMGAGNFKETVSKSMKLPEDDPATMDRMIQWIYFGYFPVDSEIETKSSDQLQEVLMASVMQFMTLYVAADKYGMIELKNDSFHRMCDLVYKKKVDLTRDEGLVGYIYENTIEGSKLRAFLLAWHVSYGPQYFKTHWTEKEVHDHPGFTADVLTGLVARATGKLDKMIRDHKKKLEEKASDDSGDSSSSDDSDEE